MQVDLLMSPELHINQLVNITSSVQKWYSGQFKIIGITHSGTISGAICGDCTTTINLLLGDKFFSNFNKNYPTQGNNQSQSQTPTNPNKSTNPDKSTTPKLSGYINKTEIIASNNSYVYPLVIKGIVTSTFDPNGKNGRKHDGVDIAVPNGTKVKASTAGTVLFAGFGTNANHYNGYGNVVVIANGANTQLYGHLSKILVKKGDIVTSSNIIGLVGSTGHSTGPHLHFEIRISGKKVNPLEYIK